MWPVPKKSAWCVFPAVDLMFPVISGCDYFGGGHLNQHCFGCAPVVAARAKSHFKSAVDRCLRPPRWYSTSAVLRDLHVFGWWLKSKTSFWHTHSFFRILLQHSRPENNRSWRRQPQSMLEYVNTHSTVKHIRRNLLILFFFFHLPTYYVRILLPSIPKEQQSHTSIEPSFTKGNWISRRSIFLWK